MGWGNFIMGLGFLDVKNSCEAEYVSPISNFEFFALYFLFLNLKNPNCEKGKGKFVVGWWDWVY